MPAVDAVESDSLLQLGRAEVVAGGQRVAGVETDADALFFLDQLDDAGSVKMGYGISFTRYFYRPQPLCAPEESWGDVRALKQGAEGLWKGLGAAR